MEVMRLKRMDSKRAKYKVGRADGLEKELGDERKS